MLKAENNLATGMVEGNVVGYQFKIALPNQTFSREQLTRLWEAFGLPTGKIPEISVKNSVIRACKEVAKEDNGRFVNRLARKVVDDADKYVVAIVDETRHTADEQNSYTQTTTAKLYKGANRLEISGPCAEEIREEYKKFSDCITSQDVRFAVYRTLETFYGAIRLISTGHLYFVPVQYGDVIPKVRDIIVQFGGEVHACEMLDTLASKDWVWGAAKEYVEIELDNIVEQARAVTKRASALRNKKEALKNTQKILDVYAELLDCETEANHVKAKITASLDEVTNLLYELETKKS